MIRQSVTITYKGREYEVIPDFKFIDYVEDRVPLIEFADSLDWNKPKVRNIAWFLYCALRPKDSSLTVDDIGNWILESLENLAQATLGCRNILSAIFSAGPEKKQKVPEDTDKKKSSSTGESTTE